MSGISKGIGIGIGFSINYSINNICNAENNKAKYTGAKPVYIRYSRNSGRGRNNTKYKNIIKTWNDE